MLPKIPYVVYFIALIILVLPSFIMKNNKFGIFIKNMSIWIVVFIIIIIIYKKFIII